MPPHKAEPVVRRPETGKVREEEGWDEAGWDREERRGERRRGKGTKPGSESARVKFLDEHRRGTQGG